jgi:hypothetical protein
MLLFVIPVWLVRGKIWFRHRVAQAMTLDPGSLPYQPRVLAYLRSQKAAGRTLVLATSAHRKIALAVAQYLDLFDAVLSSDERQNLVGKSKLKAIRTHCGYGGFEFVSTGGSDGAVMREASIVTLVNPSLPIITQRQEGPHVDRVILVKPPNRIKAAIASLRLHHWTKNLLLAVPPILAQQWNRIELIAPLTIAMLCFCLAASSIYLFNDLFDLAADRAHPVKSNRPLAKGDLHIPSGLWMAVGLFALAIVLGLLFMPSDFVLLLLAYALTASAYSIYFKRRLV